LVLLDRFSRWGRAPATHLLRALALNQLGRRAAAKALLQQHELTDRRAALFVLPRGFPCLLQLTAPVDSIMRGPGQSSVGRSGALVQVPARRKAGARPAEPPGAAVRTRPQPQVPAAPAAARPAQPPPLPRVEVGIPF